MSVDTTLWDLPESWAWARFKDVAKVDADLVDPTSLPDAVHVAPNHIESGTGRLLSSGTVASDGVTSAKHRFRPGQIIYSKIRPYLAKAVLVDFPGVCSADCYPVSSNIDTHYLHRWLVSPMFTAEAADNQGRTVLPKINQEALAELPVPVAPGPEQRRIVARLDALQARSRAARDALAEVPALLDQLRQSVLAAAFRGDLTAEWRANNPDVEPASAVLKRIVAERRRRWGVANPRKPYAEPESGEVIEIPDSWVSAPLEALADPVRSITYGIVLTGDPTPEGVPTVRCGDVKAYHVDASSLKRVRREVEAQFKRTRLTGGEVLVAIRGTVGATAVAHPGLVGCNVSREIAVVPTLPPVVPGFVAFWLGSPVGQSLLSGQVKGVAQAGINIADLKRISVPIPPVAEQEAIVAALEAMLQRLGALRSRAHDSASDLTTLDQSILARAFRGELVEQDPNDEPAEALLARLRAEAQPAKRGRRAARD